MRIINRELICGSMQLYMDENSKTIASVKTEKNCITPKIIKTIIKQYGIEETKDIIQTMYCKECNSNLFYTTCGNIILRQIYLTFK